MTSVRQASLEPICHQDMEMQIVVPLVEIKYYTNTLGATLFIYATPAGTTEIQTENTTHGLTKSIIRDPFRKL